MNVGAALGCLSRDRAVQKDSHSSLVAAALAVESAGRESVWVVATGRAGVVTAARFAGVLFAAALLLALACAITLQTLADALGLFVGRRADLSDEVGDALDPSPAASLNALMASTSLTACWLRLSAAAELSSTQRCILLRHLVELILEGNTVDPADDV